MDKQQIRDVALAVIGSRFDSAMPDWWPDTESWADEIAEKIAPLIDQYAYEYAERVIGDGELHVSHVCPQDSIPCREFGARGRLRNAQHKRNKELSPHRATKDGEGEV